ncbi:hypothetical protein AmaxDRAFT_5276 [Limnospira maxima CS-328]|uniref:Uncharacterized protein n=1 Tax=Limnospira maxima CS-328 TaxID=513049 RepID=B5W926_LIMMA|nr:hypothetical protein AmaxDRAFT_5276 [Limnospira maxima CS-328]
MLTTTGYGILILGFGLVYVKSCQVEFLETTDAFSVL